jgi:arylsulfatase B
MWWWALFVACDPTARAVGCDEGAVTPAVGGAENVLIVVLDDVGVDKVSGWGLHASAPATPRLDALAASGVRFDRAYAEPTCSPTRAALLTGRHPSRTQVGRWIDPRPDLAGLPDAEVTLAEALEQAPDDWATAAIGKWHLSVFGGAAPALDPNRQGFDTFRGILGNPNMASTSDGQTRGHDHWERVVDGAITWEDRWLTTVQVDDALEVAAGLPEPWLLYVGLSAAHSPWTVPPGLPTGGGDAERYARVVTHLDQELGRLLDGLPARDRTTVIVLSDNGTPEEVVTPPWDPVRSKGTLYEAGVRVPLIIAGPRVAAPGSVSRALVHVTDLFATVVDLAGVSPGAVLGVDGAPVVIDGRSVLPLLDDPASAGDRVCVMVESFPVNGAPSEGQRHRAVIDAGWKLWRWSEETVTAVTDDPSEEVIVAEGEVSELRRALSAYERQLGW